MSKGIIWEAPEDLVKKSKLTKFINFCKLRNYDELEAKSLSDPGWL